MSGVNSVMLMDFQYPSRADAEDAIDNIQVWLKSYGYMIPIGDELEQKIKDLLKQEIK